MWSHDLSRRGVLLALLAGGLAACQVRPVYAPGPGEAAGAVTPLAALGSIAIEAQTSRLGQSLVNELIFALRGGAALASPPLYKLHLIVTSRLTDLAVEAGSESPAARLTALTVTYTLTEIASGRVIDNATLYETTSTDFSSQRYANLRADRDAEDKLARTAAADIRMRLAMALAPKG
jgi:LPS-assembly lipoprotein